MCAVVTTSELHSYFLVRRMEVRNSFSIFFVLNIQWRGKNTGILDKIEDFSFLSILNLKNNLTKDTKKTIRWRNKMLQNYKLKS